MADAPPNAASAKTNAKDAGEKPKKKRGKKALLIPLIVLVIGLGFGGYMFIFGGKKDSAASQASTTTTTHAGPIIRLSPQTFNLSDGSALKVGLALQMVAEPKNAELAALLAPAAGGGHGGGGTDVKVDGSIPQSPLKGEEARALDICISHLGDMTYEELIRKGGRAEAKEKLAHDIQEAYEGDVVGVYFTEFTMSGSTR